MATTKTPDTVVLANSKRSVNKATYAPAKLPAETPRPGQVLEKGKFIRRLGMSGPEYDALRARAASGSPAGLSVGVLDLMAGVGRAGWPGGLRRYGRQLASTSQAALAAAGSALVELRRSAAAASTPAGTLGAAVVSGGAGATGAAASASALAGHAARTEAVVNAFTFHTPIQPIGALHLERMEMTPVGVEHGELVHSVPLTPYETVNISHREWSVTTQTFESIVTDAFEGFSETGVTDKTDLSQATDNETKHSTSLDINGSVTATYNGGAYSVTAAAAVDYSNKTDTRTSVKDSIAHSLAVTRHASARTRKDHKTSFRVSSVAGAEDLAVQTLTNPTDKPIRVDYFQLIRKWRVDLIRYGLRLTYDLVIPDPGLDMLGRVKELQELEEWLSTATFAFDLSLDAVQPTLQAWNDLQTGYGVALDPPPEPLTTVVSIDVLLEKQGNDLREANFPIEVPDGYAFDSGNLVGVIHQAHGGETPQLNLLNERSHDPGDPGSHNQPNQATDLIDLRTAPHDWGGRWGTIVVPYSYQNCVSGQISGSFQGKVRDVTVDAWRLKTWLALRDAALERFTKAVERGNDRKGYLQDLISRFDALTLRKMEHEEVMKWVLDWLLDGFPPAGNATTVFGVPPQPRDFPEPGAVPGGLPVPSSPVMGVEAADLGSQDFDEVQQYGDYVRFVQDAIEWENMLFFIYPYFWDSAQNWPFKRFLVHPDPVHREFLRGGAARVVLTVRPGFEDAFTRFVLTGDPDPGGELPAGTQPYVTIGQEVRSQAFTNYENIPPANPDRSARPLLYALQQQAWNDMQAIIAALEEHRNTNAHYPPGPEKGLPHTLKTFLLSQPQTDAFGYPTWPARLWADLQAVVDPPNFDDPAATFTDPWGHPYHYRTPSATTTVLHGDYELVSYGSNNAPGATADDPLSEDITSWAEGLLVAQWYEYTPTSALDVAVDATLTVGGPSLPG